MQGDSTESYEDVNGEVVSGAARRLGVNRDAARLFGLSRVCWLLLE